MSIGFSSVFVFVPASLSDRYLLVLGGCCEVSDLGCF